MFKEFREAIQAQFATMQKHHLFTVDLDKETMWGTYLNSFPAGTNPIFRERTEHDCQCCKRFIRDIGNVIAINGDVIMTIWDIEIDSFYQPVADAMSKLVNTAHTDFAISDVFLYPDNCVGLEETVEILANGPLFVWEHLYVELSNKHVADKEDIATFQSKTRSTQQVFKRALDEITTDAVDIVLELIDQNSLYKGEENKRTLLDFQKNKHLYGVLNDVRREHFCWLVTCTTTNRATTNIRNTAIGTLLVDLSRGININDAVTAFEHKVAPENYKRPSAVITKSMTKKASIAVEKLGYTDALSRRYAVTEDITINNVLYADREAKKQMGAFDELLNDIPEDIKSLDKVEEMHIDTFVKSLLPHVNTMELLLENSQTSNMVSLVAPVNQEAKGMFKWDNNFSWAYKGDYTDSVKERVKAAGGNIVADLCARLYWHNGDDLDLHMEEVHSMIHIFFENKNPRGTTGQLDIDMNAVRPDNAIDPVENIFYPNHKDIKDGTYRIIVHNYEKRALGNGSDGFGVDLEFMGKTYHFKYPRSIKNNEKITVAVFKYSKANGIEISESLDSTEPVKNIWGINTQQFHKVKLMMNSPNHWDDKVTGNKHYFFMLENCINPEKARGFFNEYLVDTLRDHRKVFEVLGSKMNTPNSNNQLSGLGFSSTKRNAIVCRITGKFTRTIKITF